MMEIFLKPIIDLFKGENFLWSRFDFKFFITSTNVS